MNINGILLMWGVMGIWVACGIHSFIWFSRIIDRDLENPRKNDDLAIAFLIYTMWVGPFGYLFVAYELYKGQKGKNHED